MALEVRPVADSRGWGETLVARMATRARVWQREQEAALRHARASVDRLLDSSELWELTDDGRPAGHVWFGTERGDLVVYDVAAPPPHAADVLGRVRAEAAAQGLSGIQASAAPGDSGRVAFVADPAFRLVATNMVLDLPTAPAGRDSAVVLSPMTPDEFDSFLDGEVESYAEERHSAGEPWDVALDIAREQLGNLLPDGRSSADQHLFTVREGQASVGVLWLGTERPVVFVYDVVIDPEARGRGLGAAAMRAAADWAAQRGAPAIGLNVFAPNATARGLYDRLGYRVVEDHYRAALPRGSRSDAVSSPP